MSLVLGIETSCDETAAAVVDDRRTILADVVRGQLDAHRDYGGVVPEIAARAHLEAVDLVVARAMADAGIVFDALDGVAATAGPGLIGGVIVGAMTGKAIAAAHHLPFFAVNHLEAHVLTARLTDAVDFPYLALLVSGGHCQLVAVAGVGRHRPLGSTVDDAAGEAFDKVGKMLGLGYPGGPAVERAAARGGGRRFALPRPLRGRPGCDFSFSGLKTAVRHAVEALPPGPLADADIADLCAGFQEAVADAMADRTANAIALFRRHCPGGKTLVAVGGVAANQALRARIESVAHEHGLAFVAPPPRLCTDNAAMVAWAGIERLSLGLADGLDFAPRPRWPLEELAG
ncbi:MAG: tRNA (adenosine(37)-N6)-threonylcarbamoyltransferase complex transferase subunit TsaD [Defluviicoccus sp.]|nr:tRNA (adenosine(37)-N6)-threonylcarbamoyltransferase complex transferase subunit TsaD [Defluviicoccus sp.]